MGLYNRIIRWNYAKTSQGTSFQNIYLINIYAMESSSCSNVAGQVTELAMYAQMKIDRVFKKHNIDATETFMWTIPLVDDLMVVLEHLAKEFNSAWIEGGAICMRDLFRVCKDLPIGIHPNDAYLFIRMYNISGKLEPEKSFRLHDVIVFEVNRCLSRLGLPIISLRLTSYESDMVETFATQPEPANSLSLEVTNVIANNPSCVALTNPYNVLETNYGPNTSKLFTKYGESIHTWTRPQLDELIEIYEQIVTDLNNTWTVHGESCFREIASLVCKVDMLDDKDKTQLYFGIRLYNLFGRFAAEKMVEIHDMIVTEFNKNCASVYNLPLIQVRLSNYMNITNASPSTAVTTPSTAVTTPSRAVTTSSTATKDTSQSQSQTPRWVWMLLIMIVLLLIIGVSIYVLRDSF